MEAYIRKNFMGFDPVLFLETTCKNLSREAAISQFEETIDQLAEEGTEPSNLKNWCERMKNSNYEILSTEEALGYWLIRSETENTLKARLLDSSVKGKAVDRALSSIASAVKKTTIVSCMKRKNAELLSSDRDSLVFSGVSVGTVLKNHGERQLENYLSLSAKEKHVVGMCLNSIIDLSDETPNSQRRFFSDDQWKEVKEKYSAKPKHKKVGDFKEKLKDINYLLKHLNMDDGYKKARSLEIDNLNSEDEALYSIYAHVINVYRKRKNALINSKKSNTELDCLVKLWSEIIESLFPDNKDRIYCKWGESKSSFNEFKVDCRIVITEEKKGIDLMDVEAARYFYQQKTNSDHLKLCIESKDIIDNVATHSATFNPYKTFIFMLQICQNCCDIKFLRLCDDGLYCIQDYDSLSLPFSVVDFAKESPYWFKSLFTLKNNYEKLACRFDDFDGSKDDGSHFNRKSKKASYDYKTWTRGSFYPPLDNELPMKPVNLYGDSEHKKQKTQ